MHCSISKAMMIRLFVIIVHRLITEWPSKHIYIIPKTNTFSNNAAPKQDKVKIDGQ